LLEVVMRNGIHNTLTAHFGQPDWYDRPGLVQRREARAVANAKQDIRDAGKAVIPGRVVAASSFGFWTSLLDGLYGNNATGPQLWVSPNSPLLASAFPHAPTSHRPYRGRIHARFDDIRLLRNRVFHYEPVWEGVVLPSRRRGQPARLVPLADLYADIVDSIGWVSPVLQATARHMDSFLDVHQNGYARIEAEMRKHPGVR
jgi:hypothetical protein